MADDRNQHFASKTGLRELTWFAVLWAGGVVAVLLIGGIIKFVLS